MDYIYKELPTTYKDIVSLFNEAKYFNGDFLTRNNLSYDETALTQNRVIFFNDKIQLFFRPQFNPLNQESYEKHNLPPESYTLMEVDVHTTFSINSKKIETPILNQVDFVLKINAGVRPENILEDVLSQLKHIKENGRIEFCY